jgi:hypothetical protein
MGKLCLILESGHLAIKQLKASVSYNELYLSSCAKGYAR